MVEVYEGSLFHAQMLVGLLENEGIEAFLQDEILGSRDPGWRMAGGVKVIVSNPDLEKTMSIVHDFEKTLV